MSFRTLSKLGLALSATLAIASLILLVSFGPKPSIEFTGGSLMEVRLEEGKTKNDLEASLGAFADRKALGNLSVAAIRDASGASFLVRMKPISNEQHVALIGHLEQALGKVRELKFTTIGPSVSASLRRNALIAIAVASMAVIAYLAFSFRKLPRKLNPWKFGTLAVLAFLHDILITCGIFVIIGRFTSFEFDTLFVSALLSILAFSANDTIVIYDRIRASMLDEERREDLETIVVRGLRQCVTRTANTTIAALIMLFSLFFFGAASIHWFILTLIIGTIIGTYSSYFVAAPLLLYWR